MITASRHPHPAPRRGFTLIELMVVIVIIAALVALLLPAVMSVRARARIVQVKTEIASLEAAINKFKTDFGVDPPSSITLYEDHLGWDTDSTSRAHIRRLWNNFQFTDTDFDGDTFKNKVIKLDGSECLVFFLGGMTYSKSLTFTKPYALSGFSKNRVLPFISGGNREGPYFEFDAGRLSDLDNDGFPSYVDPLQSSDAPYLYFSSNEGQGYRVDTDTTPWTNLDGCYFKHPSDPTKNKYYMFRCYYLKIPTASSAANLSAHKPQTIQIISPGFDGLYGTGGVFDPSDVSQLSINIDGTGADPVTLFNNDKRSRTEEFDNITNFSEGRLN